MEKWMSGDEPRRISNGTGANKNRIHRTRLRRYLILAAALSAFCSLALHVWLLPYSITYQEMGEKAAGFLL